MKGCYWIATILLLLLLTLLVGGLALAQVPPTVTTDAASNVTSDSATLNGVLTSLGNASSVDVSFEWGLTTSYGSETTPQTMTATGAFSYSISGLDPDTTYHFRAKAVGNGTAFGDDVTFETAGRLELEGWGWCTNNKEIVTATLDGYVTMFERSHASHSYSLHVVGNLTLVLPGAPDEVIALDMYGSRVRSLFYLRQEVTGKSASFEGTWIDAGGGQYYILTEGMIALPNPGGEGLKTARICSVVLRTPDVVVPLGDLGSFVEDVESMLTRFVRFIDNLLDSLMGLGLREILGDILTRIAILLAALRGLGTPYIP